MQTNIIIIMAGALPNIRNASGICITISCPLAPVIVGFITEAPEYVTANPSSTNDIANVARKAGTRSFITTNELITPTTMHEMIVSIRAGIIGIPYQAIKVTLNIAPNVAVVANDKSKIPAEKQKVAPRAIIVVIEIERSILTTLAELKNTLGAAIENMANAMNIAATTPQSVINFIGVYFWSSALLFTFTSSR